MGGHGPRRRTVPRRAILRARPGSVRSGSLFQLLQHGAHGGRRGHARRLAGGAGGRSSEVRARQAAVAELRPQVRVSAKTLAVLAAEAHVGQTSALAGWAAAAPAGLPDRVAALGAARRSRVVDDRASWPRAISGQPSPGRRVLCIWAGRRQAAVAAFWRRKVERRPSRDRRCRARSRALLTELLATVERERVRVAAGSRRFMQRARRPTASRRRGAIARLQSLVSALDSTHNLLFASDRPFLLLVRSQVAVAIDRWHAAHGRALGGLAEGRRRARGAGLARDLRVRASRPIRFRR